MSRLTMKLDEPIKTKYLNYEYNRIPDYDIVRGNFGRISDDMIFNKLGRLEDIEDELGCPLDVVFRAIENGIIIMGSTDKYGDSTIWVDTIPVTVTIEGKHTFEEPRLIKYEEWCFSCKNGSYSGCVALKDYKKTWWLKEDLSE